MKTDLMNAKRAAVRVGVLVLAGGMLIAPALTWAAAPVCAPTYFFAASGVSETVTIQANCTPQPQTSINQATGYQWQDTDAQNSTTAMGETSSEVVVYPSSAANGHTYSVKAKSTSNATYSNPPGVVTVSTAPPVCSLSVQGTSTIPLGASATLVPTCHGADFINWYASPSTPILPPSGGAVTPPATAGDYGYYVVGGNNYGDTSSNEVTVTVTAPAAQVTTPLCALTASPLTIGAGQSTTLIATCPGATSFHWTGSGVTGPGVASATTETGNVSATPSGSGSIAYSVAGQNANGTGTSAPVTVTVSAAPMSLCNTISPPSPSVTIGSASPQLTASCTNTPTSYVWKLDGSTVGNCTGSTCTIPANSLPSTTTYTVTVTANNAGGTGTDDASATITVSQQALSSCSSISPASPSVTTGNASPQLSASCTNTPTSYVWKLDGATVGNCTGSSCTIPANSLPTAGTYAVTVTANNAGGTGTNDANTTITVADGATPPPGCSTTPAGTLIDSTNFTWAKGAGTISILEKLSSGQTVSAKFHTPATSGVIGSFGSVQTTGYSAARYATISTCPGDFTVNRTLCWQDGGSSSAGVSFLVTSTPPANITKCVLAPDTDYYFNIGHKNPTSTQPRTYTSFTDSCPAGKTCEFFLQYGHQ